MRANLAVKARSPRLIHDRVADPYKRTPKLAQPVSCSACGAVFRKGRWQWAARHAKGGARTTCQACRRVKDDYPAGIMTLRGVFARAHLREILAVARNEEEAEAADHPMHRIMAVDDRRDKVVIKTTDIHLPGRIGRALVRAYKGEFELKFAKGAYFVRADWRREG